jgi:ribosome-associated toxin RatA of RatAB toxin-antitoxin module
MRTVNRSALVPHSPRQMYDIINDVVSYPQFLPWCVGSHVLASSDDQLVARLDLALGGLSQSFTTRNQLSPPHGMTLELVDGPFSMLAGRWSLLPLGDEGCKVSMQLRFEFNSLLVNAALGRVFTNATDQMVDAFCRRADTLHGD